jgi:hypothetical protein
MVALFEATERITRMLIDLNPRDWRPSGKPGPKLIELSPREWKSSERPEPILGLGAPGALPTVASSMAVIAVSVLIYCFRS